MTLQSLSDALATTLLHSLWIVSTVAVILSILLAHPFRQASASCRYQIALGALCLAVSLPAWIFVSQLHSSPTPPESSLASPAFASDANSLPSPKAVGENRPALPVSPTNGIVAIWLLGAAIALLRTFGGWIQLHYLCRRSTPVTDPRVLQQLSISRAQFGVRERIRLRRSDQISSPLLAGFLWPTILIPSGLLAGIPTPHLRAILAHELAHFRRWDYVINLLQSVAEAALFFHPAAWWISSVIRAEREAACDDLSVRHSVTVSQYARALAWVESRRGDAESLLPLAGVAMNSTRLSTLGRIQRLIDREQTAPTNSLGIGRTSISFVGGSVAIGLVLASGFVGEGRATLSETASPPLRFDSPDWHDVLQSRVARIDQIRAFVESGDRDWPMGRALLFVSPVTIERGGVLYRLDQETPRLFPDLPNAYLLKHRLNCLDRDLPRRDPDGDGFSVLEEFQAGTDPGSAASHPPLTDKLVYQERLKRLYRIRFDALPDGRMAQLTRLPSAAWTETRHYLSDQATASDGQIAIDAISPGAVELTHLPTRQSFRLSKGETLEIPTWFARFSLQLPGQSAFIVKEGDLFTLPPDPETRYRLDRAGEQSATITATEGSSQSLSAEAPAALQLPLQK